MSLKIEYAHASGCAEDCCIRFMRLAQMYQRRPDGMTLAMLNASAREVRACAEGHQ